MKKLVFLLAALSLGLSSCMKEDNTYKKLQPVLQGINIYQGTLSQNRVAMLPADEGLRLGMLLAEAKKQDADPSAVMSGGSLLLAQLFGSQTTLVKEGDDYVLTFDSDVVGSDGFARGGKLRIITNGAAQLSETSSVKYWEIEPQSGFKVVIYSTYGSQTINMTDGTTILYRNNDDKYVIDMANIQATFESITRDGCNWSGLFTIGVPDVSLAYSACAGKEFTISGWGSGPSLITFDGSSATRLKYEVTNGLYTTRNMIYGGTERSSFDGYLDYNTSTYPATAVTIEWSLVNNKLSETISYNGHVVTL